MGWYVQWRFHTGRRLQPDCTIIPETIASKALEEDHTVGQHQSESDLKMFDLLKVSF